MFGFEFVFVGNFTFSFSLYYTCEAKLVVKWKSRQSSFALRKRENTTHINIIIRVQNDGKVCTSLCTNDNIMMAFAMLHYDVDDYVYGIMVIITYFHF